MKSYFDRIRSFSGDAGKRRAKLLNPLAFLSNDNTCLVSDAMERILGDLLEELDKAYPRAVRPHGFSKELIIESLNNNLITVTQNMSDLREKAIKGDSSVPVILAPQGFLMLNQIRIKKANDELNRAIKDFDIASRKASKHMIWLTYALISLTIVIALLTLKLALKG